MATTLNTSELPAAVPAPMPPPHAAAAPTARGAVDLPADVPTCHAMLMETLGELGASKRLISGLQHQVQQLLRRLYGRSAESLAPEDLALFRDILGQLQPQPVETPPALQASPAAPVKPMAPRGPGHGRAVIPPTVPRKIITRDLPREEIPCPCCHQDRVIIGEEFNEKLDFIPAKLMVLRTVRKKYACKHCESQGLNPQIVVAELPYSPVEKGLAAPGLLAQVVVAKYCDHSPLYRQEAIFRRHGIELARSTLCDFAAQAAGVLEPLVDLMREELLKSRVIHTDDTPVNVQDKALGKTRIGRFWSYVGDQEHPYCVFTFSPDRGGEHPVEFLGNYRGYLQADAYPGYDRLFQGDDRGADQNNAPGDGRINCRRADEAACRAIEVGCWAHVRRKFFEAKGSDSAGSLRAIAFIRLLYDVEDVANKIDNCAHEQRRALRQELAVPRLAEFKAWLESQKIENGGRVLPKSPMGEAITYALNQWAALCVYTTRGFLAIDNNIVENTLRRVGIGRKNWLFVGSHAGGKTAAIHYSLIATCQRHGVNPWNYLKDVLTRIPGHLKSKLAELLPGNWKPLPENPDPSG